MVPPPLPYSGLLPPYANFDHTGLAPFDDLPGFGWPLLPISLDSAPISKLEFVGHERIKGIRITYRTSSGPVVVHHGAPVPTHVPDKDTVVLEDTEWLISASGRQGNLPTGPSSTRQLSFTIVNKENGQLRVAGPFGDQDADDEPFYASGPIIGFLGYANNIEVGALGFWTCGSINSP